MKRVPATALAVASAFAGVVVAEAITAMCLHAKSATRRLFASSMDSTCSCKLGDAKRGRRRRRPSPCAIPALPCRGRWNSLRRRCKQVLKPPGVERRVDAWPCNVRTCRGGRQWLSRELLEVSSEARHQAVVDRRIASAVMAFAALARWARTGALCRRFRRARWSSRCGCLRGCRAACQWRRSPSRCVSATCAVNASRNRAQGAP